MPGRLDAVYIDEAGEKKVPVMLHRAILGSFERFIGILIENYEGKLPLWLSPLNAVVVNITDSNADYVKNVTQRLQEQGFKVQSDLRNEKIGFKIRDWTLKRVPYILVAGAREAESGQLSVRSRSGKDLGSMPIEQVIDGLKRELHSLGRESFEPSKAAAVLS